MTDSAAGKMLIGSDHFGRLAGGHHAGSAAQMAYELPAASAPTAKVYSALDV